MNIDMKVRFKTVSNGRLEKAWIGRLARAVERRFRRLSKKKNSYEPGGGSRAYTNYDINSNI